MKLCKYIYKLVWEREKFGGLELCLRILYRLGIVEGNKYKKQRIAYYSSLDEERIKDELFEWYYYHTGDVLNLDNPKNFNQKIQWLKLYDSTPQKTQLADKYLVRDWIKEQIGEQYLIPLLGCWDRYEEIDFDTLPERFVLKANNGCGMNLIVKDKDKCNYAKVKKELDLWMELPFGWDGMELHYIDIPRKIIAEEYIEQMDGNLYDYKIHCFNGKPKFIVIIGDRVMNKHRFQQCFYDTNWQRLDFAYNTMNEIYKSELRRPDKLEELLEIAEKLSKDFVYVRVDLYVIDEQIKFGELTFTPTGGIAKWDSEESNKMVGNWMDISSIKENVLHKGKNL